MARHEDPWTKTRKLDEPMGSGDAWPMHMSMQPKFRFRTTRKDRKSTQLSLDLALVLTDLQYENAKKAQHGLWTIVSIVCTCTAAGSCLQSFPAPLSYWSRGYLATHLTTFLQGEIEH